MFSRCMGELWRKLHCQPPVALYRCGLAQACSLGLGSQPLRPSFHSQQQPRKNSGHHKRFKHHFLDKSITLDHVPSAENIALTGHIGGMGKLKSEGECRPITACISFNLTFLRFPSATAPVNVNLTVRLCLCGQQRHEFCCD